MILALKQKYELKQKIFSWNKSKPIIKNWVLLHFRTPPIVIDDSSWKNAAESFTVALTLTLGGYESAIAPNIGGWKKIINAFIECFQSGLRLLVSEWHFP